MSKQMHEILKQYEERQDKYANLSQEHKLQVNSTKSSSSKVCCHLAFLKDFFVIKVFFIFYSHDLQCYNNLRATLY